MMYLHMNNVPFSVAESTKILNQTERSLYHYYREFCSLKLFSTFVYNLLLPFSHQKYSYK